MMGFTELIKLNGLLLTEIAFIFHCKPMSKCLIIRFALVQSYHIKWWGLGAVLIKLKRWQEQLLFLLQTKWLKLSDLLKYKVITLNDGVYSTH
jgi:hypothetical protein